MFFGYLQILYYLCGMKEMVSHIISELHGFYSEAEARELAYWIIEQQTGMTRADVLMGRPKQLIQDLSHILHQLKCHMPIQYIFGVSEWRGLQLQVNQHTLIPRPETAELVDWIATTNSCSEPLRVMDIGTGSGCIAIALKKHCPAWHVQGVDISAEALEVAKNNAAKNAVDIVWKQMDILSEKPDSQDIIVSNPPYICHREKASMQPRVLDYEPHSALFVPDDDPLLFYRRIASIKSAKRLYFEINEAYGQEVCDMMQDLGYVDIQLKYDIYGKARMVFGRIEA